MESLTAIPGFAHYILTVLALATSVWALLRVGQTQQTSLAIRILIWATLLLLAGKLGTVLTPIGYSIFGKGSMESTDPIFQWLAWIEIGGMGLAVIGLVLLGRTFTRPK